MLFAHHMNEFNAGESDAGSRFGLEAEHGACASFDAAMILLNSVVHIFAGTDRDGIAGLSEPVLCITLQYRNAIGLASVNGNSLRPAVAGQSLAQKAFGSGQITVFAEIELNRIAIAIDRTIQVKPLASDLDIGFIEVPFTCDLALSAVEPFKQFWTELQKPAMQS